MLKVLPIQNKTEQEAFCARCGIPYREEALAYAATVDDTLVGVCQFSTAGGVGTLYDLAPVTGTRDAEALFVMGRAMLNFVDLCGMETARWEAPVENEALIGAIGFRKNEEGDYIVNLKGFFDHPCQHGQATR